MPRVNIEESVFAGSGLEKMAKSMGIHRNHALGTLTILWRDSQEELAVEGTKDQILEWAREYDEEEGNKLIKGLLHGKFITLAEDGKYKIEGNRSQIENRIKKLKGSSKGAAATKAKWEKLKKSQQGPKALKIEDHTPSEVETIAVLEALDDLGPKALESEDHTSEEVKASTTPNSVQFSSVQFNSIQSSRSSSPPGKFEVLPQLNGPPELQQLLQLCATSLQTDWLKRYRDPGWIVEKLDDCRRHYLATGEDVQSWPLAFTNWLKRDRDKPGIEQRLFGDPDAMPEADDPYGFLADEEVDGGTKA